MLINDYKSGFLLFLLLPLIAFLEIFGGHPSSSFYYVIDRLNIVIVTVIVGARALSSFSTYIALGSLSKKISLILNQNSKHGISKDIKEAIVRSGKTLSETRQWYQTSNVYINILAVLLNVFLFMYAQLYIVTAALFLSGLGYLLILQVLDHEKIEKIIQKGKEMA